jgi:hypothetical protein
MGCKQQIFLSLCYLAGFFIINQEFVFIGYFWFLMLEKHLE